MRKVFEKSVKLHFIDILNQLITIICTVAEVYERKAPFKNENGFL